MLKKEKIKFLCYFQTSDISRDGIEKNEFDIQEINNFIKYVEKESVTLENIKRKFQMSEDNAKKVHELFNCEDKAEILGNLNLFLPHYNFDFAGDQIFSYEYLNEFFRLKNDSTNISLRNISITAMISLIERGKNRYFSNCPSYKQFISNKSRIEFYTQDLTLLNPSTKFLLPLFYGKKIFIVDDFKNFIINSEDFKAQSNCHDSIYFEKYPFNKPNNISNFLKDFENIRVNINEICQQIIIADDNRMLLLDVNNRFRSLPPRQSGSEFSSKINSSSGIFSAGSQIEGQKPSTWQNCKASCKMYVNL